jgi:hypothetical protein
MADWTKNNRACTTTWTTLRVLDQNDKVFNDSGNVKMSGLTFWNAAASADMRKLQATTLATQMDNTFRMIRKANFEAGVTKEAAIAAMIDILTTEDKTISDLAAAIDEKYLFWEEGNV